MVVVELLKIVLPAVLVIVVVYLMQNHSAKQLDKTLLRMQNLKSDVALPILLSAHERLVLVLERTSPENCLQFALKPGMKSGELHLVLLDKIRTEFDHNVSQQLYISNETWDVIKTARISLVTMVNQCASMVQPDADAMVLAARILEVFQATEINPVEMAISKIKYDLSKLF